MIGIGYRVRVLTDWEPEIQGPTYKSRVGLTGTVVGLISDDHGATVQDPAIIVDNGIGMVWQEEVERVP
jgi:hypothetical protein